MNVHFVGSIGLDSVEEVFATVGPLLGERLKRIPDGEVGPRRPLDELPVPAVALEPLPAA